MSRLIGVFLFAVGFAFAQQPMITGGPVNAASYVIAGLPNAKIAQGSMFILFGQQLGPGMQANAVSFPLPKNLGGTSISVKVAGTAVDAIMLYSAFGQVAAILPSNTPVGDGTLTLTFNQHPSNTVPIHVAKSTLGIFTRSQSGFGPGVFFNFISESNQPVNSLIEAAHPGQVLTLWGTGLGPVSGDEAGGPLPGNLDVPVDVYVGTTKVTPSYKGRSGCCAGIDQVVFTVPAGVEGCYVSVNVVSNGVTSNSATIAVASNGNTCSDPGGFTTNDLAKVRNKQALVIGEVAIFRAHASLALPSGTVQGDVDLESGHFRRYFTPADVLASNRGSLGGSNGSPSLGSCTVAPFSYQDFLGAIFGHGGEHANFLGVDAGSVLNLNGPNGAKQIPRVDQGSAGSPFYVYSPPNGLLGGGLPGVLDAGPAYLSPGNYTLENGSGGSVVGSFQSSLTIPTAATWTNEDAISNVSRSKDLTLTWSGAPPGTYIGISATSADPSTGAGAAIDCLVSADAGKFTVPAWLLSALPASAVDSSAGVPVGFIYLGTLLTASQFQASGEDLGYFTWGEAVVKNVVFQ